MWGCLCACILYYFCFKVRCSTAVCVHVGDETLVALLLLPAGKLSPKSRLTRKCKAAFHHRNSAPTPHPKLNIWDHKKRSPCVRFAAVWLRLVYLFVCVVVGIYVVVKLLVSEVLLLTQLAVEKSLQILHWAAQSPLCTLLEEDRDGKNEWEHWRDWGREKKKRQSRDRESEREKEV